MDPVFSFGPFKQKFHINKLYLYLGISNIVYFYLGIVIGKVFPHWLFAFVCLNIILAQAIYIYKKVECN